SPQGLQLGGRLLWRLLLWLGSRLSGRLLRLSLGRRQCLASRGLRLGLLVRLLPRSRTVGLRRGVPRTLIARESGPHGINPAPIADDHPLGLTLFRTVGAARCCRGCGPISRSWLLRHTATSLRSRALHTSWLINVTSCCPRRRSRRPRRRRRRSSPCRHRRRSGPRRPAGPAEP